MSSSHQNNIELAFPGTPPSVGSRKFFTGGESHLNNNRLIDQLVNLKIPSSTTIGGSSWNFKTARFPNNGIVQNSYTPNNLNSP